MRRRNKNRVHIRVAYLTVQLHCSAAACLVQSTERALEQSTRPVRWHPLSYQTRSMVHRGSRCAFFDVMLVNEMACVVFCEHRPVQLVQKYNKCTYRYDTFMFYASASQFFTPRRMDYIDKNHTACSIEPVVHCDWQ